MVVESAVRRLEAIGAAGIVTAGALRRAAAEAVAGIAVLAVSIALAWPMLARASEAAWITSFRARFMWRSCRAMRACPPASR